MFSKVRPTHGKFLDTFSEIGWANDGAEMNRRTRSLKKRLGLAILVATIWAIAPQVALAHSPGIINVAPLPAWHDAYGYFLFTMSTALVGALLLRGRRRIPRIGARRAVILGVLVVAACSAPEGPSATSTPFSAFTPTVAPATSTTQPPSATATNVPASPTATQASGHEGGEGIVLGPGEDDPLPGRRCAPDDTIRAYDIAALNVEITLNRFLDYDPLGRMFALEDEVDHVRQEETLNNAARATGSEPAVSLGLQDDAIQPLVIRANQGECLRVTLRNGLANGESASLNIHGSSLYIAKTGEAAIATVPSAMAAPGTFVTYQWYIPTDTPEGTHYFHSHGNNREQTAHGLFGALIVEPSGSIYLEPKTGEALRSGWAAIIRDPNGSDFREFTITYHEIGDESYELRDGTGEEKTQTDPFTKAYRPASRAINYRSEPFMNRLNAVTDGQVDVSQVYSSYTFGDPATPIARTYLGDPVKQRLVHGGSETIHVHHVHGGAIRWRRQPGTEDTAFDTGLDKFPPLTPEVSARVDSQSVGPSESYDLEHECGAGGCQQSTGDFLVHCHVAQHYISGMWMVWRVYNTLQVGAVGQDALPALVELPDRVTRLEPAVTSDELVGRTVDWKGQTFDIEEANLSEWVERQLPPQGQRNGHDASVLDWAVDGDVYLNEPDSAESWPGFTSLMPGDRPPLRFNPVTGKLAYPFLRPHLGMRPPFAPNHGPSPFLEPFRQGTDPPEPGENGPWSLCPSGTEPQQFNIHAITLPITHNSVDRPGWGQLVDERGQLFVLKEEEEAIRTNDELKTPLAIRGNAGQDCVDVVLKSELRDDDDKLKFSKVNIHIHFVQFDIQASDGVNTGFNYEQSVRPFTVEGERLTVAASAGDRQVAITNTSRFQTGVLVGVGMDQSETFEVRRIKAIDGDTVTFEEPLRYEHGIDEIISVEFVRYRWYPDVQFGTAYFHDHVNALNSWQHGLFGAFVSEPPDSTYHDPFTGEERRSGPIVDVHTEGSVSVDVAGSFREMVMFIQDEHPILSVGRGSGSAINLRAEPLVFRGGESSRLFSSEIHSDPVTPLLEAYLGDPIVVRSLVPATNAAHTWHIDGHWFRIEPYSGLSPPTSTVHLGISERYDLSINAAGGPQRLPGDYLYYNGLSGKLEEGSWGLLRVHDGGADTALRKLPGHEAIPPRADAVCPVDAPLKEFAVAAVDVSLPMAPDRVGKAYVLQSDKQRVREGELEVEPLVLHVNVGDCIRIELSNETADGPVSFHTTMLAFDPLTSYGVEAGRNPGQVAGPGESRSYTFYAHPEVGETTALVRDWGNVVLNPRLGMYGAIVVGPKGATYTHPATGEDMSMRSGWRVDVHPPEGPSYRDFTVFLHDEDDSIGTASMDYAAQVEKVVGLSYQIAPLEARRSAGFDVSALFRSDVHGMPPTPLLEAFTGDDVRLHVLVPYGSQNQVFSVEGHAWPMEPGRVGSDLLSAVQIGGMEAITLRLWGGAGGLAGLPGDYLYGNHREPYREAGVWGIFRVHEREAADTGLRGLGEG